MKRLLRRGVMISVMFLGLALMIGLEVESAQEQLTYVGRVITIYGSTLSVEADNGMSCILLWEGAPCISLLGCLRSANG